MSVKLMLAAKTDGHNVAYPVLASPKLDGVRATVSNGVVLSRNAKPIPNSYVQTLFGHRHFSGLDGELIVGDPWDPTCFRSTSSGVMTTEGRPSVVFHVFDVVPTDVYRDKTFKERIDLIYSLKLAKRSQINIVSQVLVGCFEELMAYEQQCLEIGYEGVMLRHPHGLYKNGRCGQRDPWLLKLKRFEDSEAEIIGFVERMHNANEATKDELGRTKRSSHKANKRGTSTLGALTVREMRTGVEFEVGTGFDDGLRLAIWKNKDYYGKKIVKYKFFPTGSKDKPRFPVFLGFRDAIDI